MIISIYLQKFGCIKYKVLCKNQLTYWLAIVSNRVLVFCQSGMTSVIN